MVTPRADLWRRTEATAPQEPELSGGEARILATPHRWAFLAPRHVRAPFEHGGRLRRAAGDRLGRLARRAAERLGVPKEAGWRRDVLDAARAISEGAFDLVLATGSPFVAFDLARELSRRLDCPYVLDYRDLWSGNPYAPPATPREQERERKDLADSAAVLAASPGIAASLAERFDLGGRIRVVTNGFDSEDLGSVAPHDFAHFAIVFAGRFYPPALAVTPLLAALARLSAAPAPRGWRFHYYGRYGDHVRAEAARFGLAENVALHGEVSRAEALSAVRGAALAVVITSAAGRGSAAERGVITGKVFEAIGLRTPVLAIAPDKSDLDGVLETAGGGRRFAPDDADGIAAYVAAAMRGETPPWRRPDAYDWRNLAPALDRILREAAARGAGAA